MSGVGVIIHAAKESCRHVFPGVFREKKGSSRVLINKRGHVVYKARNQDYGPRFRLLLNYI
jgi:hypothetical protein